MGNPEKHDVSEASQTTAINKKTFLPQSPEVVFVFFLRVYILPYMLTICISNVYNYCFKQIIPFYPGYGKPYLYSGY